MVVTRLAAGLCLAAGVALAAQQPGAPPAKPDSPEVKQLIEQVRKDAGPRWAYAVHFWCEEPRANRQDDPVIPPTKIFDNVYAIGNSGTTVYVIRTSAGLLMIDALGAGDATATTTQLESQLLPGFQKLGDLKVTPVAVPGHTPGSMGFIFPVKDNGTAHTAGLYGGVWLTPGILSDDALQTYLASVKRFQDATSRAKVDVILQNHMLMDPILPKVEALVARKRGEPNPFVVGAAEYQKCLGVMDGCTRVNLARRAS